MAKMTPCRLICLVLSLFAWRGEAWQLQASLASPKDGFRSNREATTIASADRRDFLTRTCCLFVASTGSSFIVSPSHAAQKGIDSKIVNILWDVKPTGSFPIAVNGVTTSKGSSVRISYQLPKKWDSGNRIIVYQKTGTASQDQLEKAVDLGIPRALDIGDRIEIGLQQTLRKANLIGMQSVVKDDRSRQTYFEFFMGSPASTDCEPVDCVYDSRYLLAATVFNRRLYVLVLQCDESQWNLASQDLLRVLSSFQVNAVV